MAVTRWRLGDMPVDYLIGTPDYQTALQLLDKVRRISDLRLKRIRTIALLTDVDRELRGLLFPTLSGDETPSWTTPLAEDLEGASLERLGQTSTVESESVESLGDFLRN